MRFLEYLFPKKRKRLELRYVAFPEGDRLIREGWKLAKEEDTNMNFGMVYVEKLSGGEDEA